MQTKRKENEAKRADADTDPERRKAQEIRDFMQKNTKVFEPGSLESLSDEELSDRVKELSHWKDLEARQLTANEEIVFCDQHFCNDNLKKRVDVHTEKKISRKAKDSDDEIEEAFDENGKPIFKEESFLKKPDEIINMNQNVKKTLTELEKVSIVWLIMYSRPMVKTL